MNEKICDQIKTMLANIGYTGPVISTDENTVTIFLEESSTTEPPTTPPTEPPTTPPTEPPTTPPTEPPTTPPTEPPTTPSAEPPTLESIIEQQNARIEALTNKLNEIFKISPNAQPKNEWESYLDNPNSATYRAMKEAGLIKENNNA